MFRSRGEILDEEKFILGYMQLAGCTESFARCVFMFFEVAANRKNSVHQASPPNSGLLYEYNSFRTDGVD